MFDTFMMMPHVVFGVLGITTTIWVLIEIINVSEQNKKRLRISSMLTSIFFFLAYILGGWWYVVDYGKDKAKILAGSFPAAHSFFMETKEHTFFILLLLGVILPVIIYKNQLIDNKSAKKLAISVTVMIIILGFGMEGFGSMIAAGVKVGLLGGK